MMPKRIAETPASEQISEYVGSGPFVFARDEWEPGNKAVFTRFEDYQPRSEPPSWAAGGKEAKVDRVEWVWIPDMQTAVNALINGEIDVIEIALARPAADPRGRRRASSCSTTTRSATSTCSA